MGVHIGIENTNGDDHPDWDYLRHSGDREAAFLVFNIEHIVWDDWLVRPVDVTAFINKIRETVDCNADRWTQLEEILKDPNWWMQVSW